MLIVPFIVSNTAIEIGVITLFRNISFPLRCLNMMSDASCHLFPNPFWFHISIVSYLNT
jgi:hypothetical protein